MMKKKERDEYMREMKTQPYWKLEVWLENCLEDLDTKDDQITALSAKIYQIRKTAFEMISIQTDKIAKLRSGYVASQEQLIEKKFVNLPLGTRFKFFGCDETWVILETHGCGLIARWQGFDGPVAGQSMCSATEVESRTNRLVVCVVE